MMMLHRLSAVFLAAVLALPAAAQDRIPLAEISRYLNGITTAEAEFTQVNADGSVSTGTLYMHRPGRIRFEYDPPAPALVMAGGGTVAIFDAKSNVAPEQYPLRRTPLSIILERDVNLGRSDMVVAHDGDGTRTEVVAQDPEHPEYGNIRMIFTADPVELRQWVVTNEAGTETTVILGEMETGAELSSRLFSIVTELRTRGLTE